MTAAFKQPDLAQFPQLVERCWRDVRIAASFLTCLPVTLPASEGTAASASGADTDEEARAETSLGQAWLAEASGMFPLIGVLIGSAASLTMLLAYQINLHPLACALIAVLTSVLLTGALHEDGLADFADGLGGGRTIERRLAIMRDSRIGTFGTLALVFSIGLRATLISQQTSFENAALAVIAAAVLSRAALPAVMRWLPPARTDGLAFMAGTASPTQVTTAVSLACVVALILLGIGPAITAVACAVLAAMIIALIAKRRLGGQTGDVLGAVQQTVEVFVLAAIAASE